MSEIILQSPAKLNLYLKVINKRPDGFHNIVTLFERIDLFDDISFCSSQKDSIIISCDHPNVPVGPKNLVYKAAKMLKVDFKVKQGVEIRINKRIPVAAGLAGGSSNGATALMGLNKLWNLGLSKEKLLPYARRLGSDVAFFLYRSSWGLGTSRGDEIEILKLKAKLWHILVVPRIKIYSRDVYSRHKLQLTKRNDNVNILIHNLSNGNILGVGSLLSNDLEIDVIKLCPKLLDLKEKLKSFNPLGVMVSGSGPSVFGVTTTKKEAEEIANILSKRFSQVFVVRTL
ncbi:MAG: 4-(cytidine 5'-diphospho)-2-C-methyl-D-erythritol kinase [Candidatus Omnitrophica bacterium]|nr:4-(cytidine 5'-diphospho)-2-C-methyl-D-erythritol kinase [Candidatus Omnitrophota bacterium]MBU1995751.1 4-(cytidine 5'-diphospho)-2-C-methyl-D-erythritol kinase [Candidatus Omnitrophota bacterium]